MAKEKEEMPEEEIPEEEETSIGLKEGEQPDANQEWKKVEAIMNSAKTALDEGTLFPDVLTTVIETLTALQTETNDKLGGLGVGGPEMDLPEDGEFEPEAEEEE